MLCKDNMANLDFKFKKIMQNTFCFPFPYLFIYYYYFYLKKKNQKQNKSHLTWNAWMICNANPKKKKKKQRKQKQQRGMVTKNRTMKHKDYVKKTQLNRVFCIQNFLDATLVLELLFILKCWATPELE